MENTIPLWAIILFVIGGLVLILLLVWSYCAIHSSQRRKERRAELEQKIYEKERDRAEATLAALRSANIARNQGYQGPCQHYHGTPPLSGGCPICGPSVGYATGDTPYQGPMYHHDPSTSLVAAATALPIVPVQPSGLAPHSAIAFVPSVTQSSYLTPIQPVVTTNLHPLTTEIRQPQLYPVINVPTTAIPSGTNYPGSVGENVRLAYNETEIPSTPPPIAPSGFVTVPMVREKPQL